MTLAQAFFLQRRSINKRWNFLIFLSFIHPLFYCINCIAIMYAHRLFRIPLLNILLKKKNRSNVGRQCEQKKLYRKTNFININISYTAEPMFQFHSHWPHVCPRIKIINLYGFAASQTNSFHYFCFNTQNNWIRCCNETIFGEFRPRFITEVKFRYWNISLGGKNCSIWKLAVQGHPPLPEQAPRHLPCRCQQLTVVRCW